MNCPRATMTYQNQLSFQELCRQCRHIKTRLRVSTICPNPVGCLVGLTNSISKVTMASEVRSDRMVFEQTRCTPVIRSRGARALLSAELPVTNPQLVKIFSATASEDTSSPVATNKLKCPLRQKCLLQTIFSLIILATSRFP